MNLYDKYEGQILGAIDKALSGTWFNRLSESEIEAIHDKLFTVLTSEEECLSPATKRIVKRTMDKLRLGDPISNSELHITIQELKGVLEFFSCINFRKYDLMVDDLRKDLNTLESFEFARKG